MVGRGDMICEDNSPRKRETNGRMDGQGGWCLNLGSLSKCYFELLAAKIHYKVYNFSRLSQRFIFVASPFLSQQFGLENLRVAAFSPPRVRDTPDCSPRLCDIDSGSGRDIEVD